MKIYGPYIRKDGRSHICIVHDNGKKQTKSYPRYLMEAYLNRELLPEETVDHINNNFRDNRIENLQILSLSDNAKKQNQLNPRKTITFICPNCKKEGIQWKSDVDHNRKKANLGLIAVENVQDNIHTKILGTARSGHH